MDSYLLGESLVQEMTLGGVDIGQNDCPVVFVGHSLGGLIARQIVISGHRQISTDERVGKLLRNVKAFFFYATPHGGSKLAGLAGYIPFLPTGPLVKYLQVLNDEVGRLNTEFEQIHRDVVGEMHATSYAQVSVRFVYVFVRNNMYTVARSL
jgi:triacylglycerol esterase/lipase EstA (alpha/beta hydrolase family)